MSDENQPKGGNQPINIKSAQYQIAQPQTVRPTEPPEDNLGPAPAPPKASAPNPSELAKRWPVRGAVILGLAGVLLLFGGFGSWAMLTRIAGAVVAPGQVEVQQNRQVVQHPDGGVIDEIMVVEGDSVELGQTLIRLDGTLLTTELTIVEGQYFEDSRPPWPAGGRARRCRGSHLPRRACRKGCLGRVAGAVDGGTAQPVHRPA